MNGMQLVILAIVVIVFVFLVLWIIAAAEPPDWLFELIWSPKNG